MSNLRETLTKPLKGLEDFYKDLRGYLFQPQEIKELRKKREFTSTTPNWHHSGMNSPAYWGTIMANGKSSTDFDTPPTLEEFWNRQKIAYDNRSNPKQYTKAVEGDDYPTHLVRSAKDWQRKRIVDETRPPISFEQAITETFIRTTLQSWEGYIGEMITLEYLTEHLPQLSKYAGVELMIEEPPTAWDFDYNCDLLLRKKTGELMAGIQVKPRSYIYPSKTSAKAKEINSYKDNKFEKEQGARIWYFEKETAILNEPARLISGESIHSSSKRLKTISIQGDTFIRTYEGLR